MKKLLSIIMLGLTASSFGMQSSIDSQLEQVAQEFHACYAKVRVVIEKIIAEQELNLGELSICEKNLTQARSLLKTAREFLRSHGDAMSEELCYRCANFLGVPDLAPFESIPQLTRLLILKNRIGAQMMRLDTEISTQCDLIIDGCKAALELRKVSGACSSNLPGLAEVVDVPLFQKNVQKNRSSYMRKTLIAASFALAGVSAAVLANYPRTIPSIVVSALPKVMPIVAATPKGILRHIVPVALSAIASGIWAVRHSIPAEIVRDFLNITEPSSWFNLFSGV